MMVRPRCALVSLPELEAPASDDPEFGTPNSSGRKWGRMRAMNFGAAGERDNDCRAPRTALVLVTHGSSAAAPATALLSPCLAIR